MKRVLLIIVISLLSFNYALCKGYNFVIDGIYYSVTTLNNDGGEVQVETGMWAEVRENYVVYCKTPTYVDTLTIPENVEDQGLKFKVTSIGEAAFGTCDIKAIYLPNSIKTINANAFGSCNLLKSIVIPGSVTEIKKSAFSGCSNLKEVQLSDGLQYIGEHAFSDCSSLSSIIIPNTVTYLGRQAFNNCRSLTSVKIPNSVTDIEGNPFCWCTSLSSVTIGCTVIPSLLGFSGCNIKELTLTKDVKEIKGLFFRDLQTVETLYSLNSSPPSVEFYWEEPCNNNCVLYVPLGSVSSYKKDQYWGKYKTIVENTRLGKCASPTIIFEDGKISFKCETEGVEFVANISTSDTKDYYDAELTLSYKYMVTVYATKEGYNNSDVITREIVIIDNGTAILVGDVNQDGKVDVADHVKLSDIIMGKE